MVRIILPLKVSLKQQKGTSGGQRQVLGQRLQKPSRTEVAPTLPKVFTVFCCCLALGESGEMLQRVPSHHFRAAAFSSRAVSWQSLEEQKQKMPCGCVSLMGSGPKQPRPPHPHSWGEWEIYRKTQFLLKHITRLLSTSKNTVSMACLTVSTRTLHTLSGFFSFFFFKEHSVFYI